MAANDTDTSSWLALTNFKPVKHKDEDFDAIDENCIMESKVDNNHVTPVAEPIHPSAIDFSRVSVTSTNNYNGPSGSSTVGLTELKNLAFQKLTTGTVDQVVPTRNHNSTLDTYKKEKSKTEARTFEVVRLCITIVFLVFGVVGTVLLVILLKDEHLSNPPQQQKGNIHVQKKSSCDLAPAISNGIVRFNSPLILICQVYGNVSLSNSTMLTVDYKPHNKFLWMQSSYDILLNSTSVISALWTVNISSVHPHFNFTLTRDPVKCDSGGIYEIELKSKGNTLIEEEIEIRIESDISEIDLNVDQSSRNETSSHELSCSAKSDCSPSPIMLWGVINNTKVPLHYINFTCIIHYNYVDGWAVNCTGLIPDAILSNYQSILCQHVTGNETTAIEKEKEIPTTAFCVGEDCNFKCPNEAGDIFYLDPRFCYIWHRCYEQVLYTHPCGANTYFNTETCVCDHKSEVNGCTTNGTRTSQYTGKTRCDTSK